jgi:hypothetical protein
LNQCIHNLKNIQMILKQKRGESSGKKVSSAIQRKQEYAKKHSNSLARAAT